MSVYSDGERRAAVHLAVEHGGPEAARRTGVNQKTIYQWAARLGVSMPGGRRGRRVSGHDVALLLGVTYRRVDHLARTGVVVPTIQADGSGHHRHYTPDDVDAVRVVCDLVDLGMTPAALAPLDRPTRTRLLTAMQDVLDSERQPCDEGVASSTTADGERVPAERPR